VPDSLKIHTHEFFPKIGGIGRYCHELATGAVKLDWAVTISGPKLTGYPPVKDSPAYYIRNGAHGPSLGLINIWKSRSQLAEEFRMDSASLHLLAEPGPILACGLLPRSAYPKRLRVVLHGSEIERWSSPISVAGRIAARSLYLADSIIVPSEAIAKKVIARFPSTKDYIRVVHHALPEVFKAAAISSLEAQKDNKDGRINLLSVGRIHPRKGFDQVLKALQGLSGKEKSVLRYTIAGSRCKNSYEYKLRELAKRSGCEVHFNFDPSDTELINLYGKANLFALTSVPRRKSVEGFGLVYLEAAAFGIPSIAYRVGGVEAAVRNGETGYLLTVQNTKSISEQLRAIIQNPEVLLTLGSRARQRALSRSWSDVASESLS
jgi:phosphatidylinositol alpha-1,6-mannosyltransferase